MNPSAKRKPSSRLVDELVGAARQLGAREVCLADSETCFDALAAAGAAVCRHVIRYPGDEPYVVETARLIVTRLVVVARKPRRPASAAEVRALDSHEAYQHLGDYQGVEIPDAD